LRRGQFAISLAMVLDGRIEVAALACPSLPASPGQTPNGAIFLAVRGQGAVVLAMDKADSPRPIHVSATKHVSQARLCESVESGHSSHQDSAALALLLDNARAPIRMDSQAKYAIVARGEADVYLRLPTRADYREKIWDHAGGVLIVTEAGGAVTDI